MFLVRVRSVGFLDVYGALSTRKGERVMKSSLGSLFIFQGPVFYKV